MGDRAGFVASLLRNGGGALAGFAAGALVEQHPHLAERYGPDAFSVWKRWFVDRIEDMSAAVAADSTELFDNQIQWAKSLLTGRGLSPADLRPALESLQSTLQEQLPPETRSVVDSFIGSALDACEQELVASPSLLAGSPAEKLATEYLAALLEGNRQQAARLLLDARDGGQRIEDIYLNVLSPALEETGRMWTTGEVSVAEEHFVTATTREAMSQLQSTAARAEPNGRTVLAAAVAGNQHDIGLQMTTDLFEAAGWRTVNLGANVPLPDVSEAVVSFAANLLLLSAALPAHIATVRDTIQFVRGQGFEALKILVGGSVLRKTPQVTEQLGADGYAATAADALAMANRMFQV